MLKRGIPTPDVSNVTNVVFSRLRRRATDGQAAKVSALDCMRRRPAGAFFSQEMLLLDGEE